MKYERTEQVKRDYRKLSEAEREQFKQTVAEHFRPAVERRVEDPGSEWPKRLRVKGVKGADGIWDMTWHFSDPDGRATWEWTTIAGESALRWRRVGSHAIFSDP